MGTETPDRPFESLEWYRAAVRSNRSDERGAARVLSWLKGIEFLTVHISVFAVGVVALLVINLLRSPQDLWVDRAGAAWAMLLTIHAVSIGLIWAIGLLGKDDHEALQVIPDAEWRRSSASWPRAVVKKGPPATAIATSAHQGGTPAAPASGEELASQPAHQPSSPAADGQPPQPMPPGPPGWSAWGQETGQVPPSAEPNEPNEPKASWKEAATWLTRSGRGRRPSSTEAPPGDRSPPSGSPPT